jgi:signal transduction histidine kinase/CheY-like chemotaxis protein
MRLLNSLSLLSSATVLPVLGFALLAAGFVVQGENESLISASKSRNRATLAAVDAEIRGAIGTLQALRNTSSLASGDFEAFHRYARTVLSTQPSWQNIVLTERSGRQVVNARLPWGAALLPRDVDTPSFDAAIASRKPAVGDLSFAPRLNNEPGIAVRVPIGGGSGVTHVLTAVLSVGSFQQQLADQGIPKDWVSGIVDNTGRLVARVPPVQAGQMASEDYLRHVRSDREGWYRGKTLEGKDTFTAFSTSDLTGWTIGYAVPSDALLGGVTRAAWLMAGGLALSIAAAAMIAIGLSRRIALPLTQLASAAASLAQGKEQPAVESSVDEIRLLSSAFAEASRSLVARDNELRRSSEDLRKQAVDLRQADANKSRFLALLAHELRNPLAPLRNGLAILKKSGITPEREGTRAMMERQIEHMARLIDDLLDVSRIDRGQIELHRERVALDTLVSNAIDSAKPGIEAKQQELVARFAPAALHVDGDPVRLTQVISNLLQNAAKFSPPRSRIDIGIARAGHEAVLTVKDSGIGFDPASNSRIFELFVRLDGHGGQASGGLGIGLTIVKSLVEMHGGRVQAHSDGAGQGATFEVRLPLSKEPVLLRAPESAIVAIPLPSRRRVLVVDDNVDAAESMLEMLRLDGFDVRASYDGQQALQVAREFKPAVAFLDLHMPGMSGTELAAALMREPWAGALRLIALTGMGGSSDVQATQRAGFDAHLTKPARPEDLVRYASEPGSNVVPLFAERPRTP